ncbi:hypothetical protein B9T25_04775 [Acinetobacter sp. ANC 4470]|uniref:DUF1656 domain-containing protein n=1 Tax=Acinetobacter sp. ANC 4470 TaxID=1977881 RepID=UPI000A3582F5|nr:DUF1656 domain-containing protein [Acinetobacter sp. ANC 4470]OTG68800.1 hypothetical protein B9T25_04775 [Acinetobacter sp. ANC 4470]
MGELNLYGVYVPILLIQSMLAYILLKIVMMATDRLVDQGWIAWPSLFNLCLYAVLIFLVHWLFILSGI